MEGFTIPSGLVHTVVCDESLCENRFGNYFLSFVDTGSFFFARNIPTTNLPFWVSGNFSVGSENSVCTSSEIFGVVQPGFHWLTAKGEYYAQGADYYDIPRLCQWSFGGNDIAFHGHIDDILYSVHFGKISWRSGPLVLR